MNTLKASLFFIVLFALARLIPHPPNFTPLIAAAIFLPFFTKDLRVIVSLPIVVMFVADFFIGFHGLMIWTYGAFVLISISGSKLFNGKLNRLIVLSLSSPTIFFFITNFGVWLGSQAYASSFNGLLSCYIAGLPFYANSIAACVLFSLSFFIAKELIKNGAVRLTK